MNRVFATILISLFLLSLNSHAQKVSSGYILLLTDLQNEDSRSVAFLGIDDVQRTILPVNTSLGVLTSACKAMFPNISVGADTSVLEKLEGQTLKVATVPSGTLSLDTPRHLDFIFDLSHGCGIDIRMKPLIELNLSSALFHSGKAWSATSSPIVLLEKCGEFDGNKWQAFTVMCAHSFARILDAKINSESFAENPELFWKHAMPNLFAQMPTKIEAVRYYPNKGSVLFKWTRIEDTISKSDEIAAMLRELLIDGITSTQTK